MEKKYIHYAVTLTTGDPPNPLIIKCKNNALNNLLYDYKKYFTNFKFNIEILDKFLLETKIHYHGYIIVPVSNIQYFHKFIREWEKNYFTKTVLVTDMDKWEEYIEKQQDILREGYPQIKQYTFNPQNVQTTNLLKKFGKVYLPT